MYFSSTGVDLYKRLISLDKSPKQSFFLWGPRQSGKSTLLKSLYPHAYWIDLLHSDVFARYAQSPHLLREEALAQRANGDLIVIDEVQKVPQLLDEVHWLIENKGLIFVLSGSSARKLKRGSGNLLGGRALRKELHGLVSAEVGAEFSLLRALNHGTLPAHYLTDEVWPRLASYTGDYLKEEVAAEGLVRNLPIFGSFLSLAARADTEPVNYTAFSRDVGVSSQTIKDYYQILIDTLLGVFLPLYKKRPKRRIQGADKFYFFDLGVVNFLAKRKSIEPRSELFGKAFENWLLHELTAYNHYKGLHADFTYWRLSTGVEVDFIVNDMEICIEAKATHQVNQNHIHGLQQIKEDHPNIGRRIIVSLDKTKRLLNNGIEVYPWDEFVSDLWAGNIF
jgi:predicted AAA+ superfamily ATPase